MTRSSNPLFWWIPNTTFGIDKLSPSEMSDLVLTFSKRWTSCYFSGQQHFFSHSLFFFLLPTITLFFLIMFPCTMLAHLLSLYFSKICLVCGTFQCFTDEVSISIPSLEVRKLNHRKKTRSPKNRGLNPQNLIANLMLLVWPCFFCYSCSSLLGIFIELAPLASLPLLLDLPAVFTS